MDSLKDSAGEVETGKGFQWREVLLWVALFPGALLGSTLAYWIMSFCVALFSARYGNPSWGYAIWTEGAINGSCGAAWIYSAAHIAPRRTIAVVIIFVVFGMLVTSFSFFSAYNRQDWSSLRGAFFFNAGAIVTTIAILQGGTSLIQKR